MTTQTSIAAIIRCDRVIGWTNTAAKNGARVAYGTALDGGGLLEIGRAKISRAQKNLRVVKRMQIASDTKDYYAVNYGGGEAI